MSDQQKTNKKKAKPSPFQDPSNCPVKADQRSQAHAILADRDKLAIRYIKGNPTAKYVRNKKGRRVLVVDPGQIVGCLVGLNIDGDIRIGWSSRADDEKVCPSKNAALYTAVLRAICDDVVKEEGKAHVSGESDKVIPGRIISEFATFTARIEKYFKTPIKNYLTAKVQ